MFSARTVKGPVTPNMVKGWHEKLRSVSLVVDNMFKPASCTHSAKMMPHKPVLNTISMVPHDLPVSV